MDINQVMIEGIMNKLKDDVRELARIYDSHDIFGIAYEKYTEKIIEIINQYLEK